MASTEQPKNPPQNEADGARAQFSELAGEAAQGGGVMNLDLLLDVPLALTLEVGRTQISVQISWP